MFTQFMLLIIFVACYAIGGQGLKWMRHWVGPSVFGAGTLINASVNHHFGWPLLIGCLWYLLAANSFSYGEDFTKNKIWKKILFRGLCGLMYGISGLLIGLHGLGIYQLLTAVAGSIIFGVLNPFKNLGNNGVVIEDVLIATGYTIFIPFMVSF